MPDLAPLFPVRREHLEALTDGRGIFQHARGIEPDPAHGTCTDDVARALLVDLDHAEAQGPAFVNGSIQRSLTYLVDAFNPATGSFHNFRSAEGQWLDEVGSEDCHGRAMLALAGAASRCRESEVQRIAADLLGLTTPRALELSAIRALSSATLACAARVDASAESKLRPVLVDLSGRLMAAFSNGAHAPDWPWPEEVVTYESALPARALIVAGQRLGRAEMTDMGLATLDWLLSKQITANGQFDPIGNHGWMRRDGAKARFDQQPIEAGAVVLATEAAFEATSNPTYMAAAESAYAWFLGRNELGLMVADPERGGCRDGMGADGLNQNQGAESTLTWLASLEAIRRLRRLSVS